jgi:large subunit ribosomal protein L9
MAKSATKKAPAKTVGSTGLHEPKKKIRKRNQVKKGPHGGTVVVLVNDLAHVGKQGEIVEVKPGYARNYLLPYGLAVIPSDENLRTLAEYKIKVEKAREAKIADLKVLAEQLTRLPPITIEANAHEQTDDQGITHYPLYGSIGAGDISKALKGKNLMVEADMIKLEHPIKEAQTLTQVPLSLGYGIEASVQLLIVALQPGKKSPFCAFTPPSKTRADASTIFRRESPFKQQVLPLFHSVAFVDSQNLDGNDPGEGFADENGLFPIKVAMPILFSRIEQRIDSTSMNSRQIRSFERIALSA